ncbi:amidohydrolase family protein [Rhodococcus sp. 14-2483-1-2]|uniref:amidohydrolase family protein n=1 Tax=Rhodococcus sp. 14-2483-1-2 TaxID=2023147 RepID=UPI000B9BEB7D|nr:amidohydrolase family protein [Rhodococcus sp. 14-2483-1-2]OZF26073.1 4-hydroxyphenyl-beta-ketoacyl-CoA hydrolase [Rhodococcus sp. 14-2483-1-2]
MSEIDLNAIEAIDVHVHVLAGRDGIPPVSRLNKDQNRRWESSTRMTVDALAAQYRMWNMAAVVFSVDTEALTGETPLDNLEIIEDAQRHADVLIPFASIDPARGQAAVRSARSAIAAGAKGFKFHPSLQCFYPNDRAAYPLYDAIAEAGLPSVFHSGQTGAGRTLPGGGGVRLKYSQPLHLDDVAADFPDMPIIIAHPSFPWQQEALAVAHHKEKVFIDLSGWSPKYFPEQLVHYANSLLKDKVLFGSDFPVLTPHRWISDYDQRGFKPELRQRHLKDNAARLLGIGSP